MKNEKKREIVVFHDMTTQSTGFESKSSPGWMKMIQSVGLILTVFLYSNFYNESSSQLKLSKDMTHAKTFKENK